MDHIEIDFSSPPVLVSRFRPGITNDEYEIYLSKLTEHLDQVERYVSINIVESTARMPSRHRELQTDWLRQNASKMSERSMGAAFVFPSAIFRFAFSVILTVQRFPVPFTTTATWEEALEWVRRRLRLEGYDLAPDALPKKVF